MAQFWEKTVEVFGGFVEYPQLTEKYLRRPPFKYLFQIFLTLQSKTGFARTAFGEAELNPDFYDTPEKKMGFLKTLLRLVYGSTPSALKPQNVIKGTECEQTNEFLQDLFRAAVAKPQETAPKPPAPKARESSRPPVPPATAAEAKPAEAKVVEAKAVEAKGAQGKGTETKLGDAKGGATVPGKSGQNKENNHEKRNAEPKTLQVVAEAAAREEQAVAKPRVPSGGPGDGIRMGKLVQSAARPSGEVAETETRELTAEEIKGVVQRLTQNTNPLGKLVEFVEDDLEAMHRECQRWVRAFAETQEKLGRAEEEHTAELAGCQLTLNDLAEQIFDYEARVQSVRSRIQRNNAKIDAMLARVIG